MLKKIKMEKMQRMKEAGNYYMKANARLQQRKNGGNPMARSDPELPTIQNRPMNQGFHSLTPTGNKNQNQYGSNVNQSNPYFNNNTNNQMTSNIQSNNNSSNYNNNGFDF